MFSYDLSRHLGLKFAPTITFVHDAMPESSAHNVEMPITQAVYGVCHQGLAVSDMVAALMGRTKKSE